MRTRFASLVLVTLALTGVAVDCAIVGHAAAAEIAAIAARQRVEKTSFTDGEIVEMDGATGTIHRLSS